jgi:hypothetical protein
VALKIDAGGLPNLRRTGDREVPFVINLEFEEAQSPGQVPGRGQGIYRTLVRVSISPQRSRDRRQRDVVERARQLFVSLKSYLVAQEQDPNALVTPSALPTDPVAGILQLAQKSGSDWLSKKD